MTHVNIPNRPNPKDLRDIDAILADYDAITAVINGGLDSTNLAEASIKWDRLAASKSGRVKENLSLAGEHEISVTRAAIVKVELYVNSASEAGHMKINIGGIGIANVTSIPARVDNSAIIPILETTFLLLAKEKWVVAEHNVSATNLVQTYVLL